MNPTVLSWALAQPAGTRAAVLAAAFTGGTTRVTFDGRTVEYRSLDELGRAPVHIQLRDMQRDRADDRTGHLTPLPAREADEHRAGVRTRNADGGCAHKDRPRH